MLGFACVGVFSDVGAGVWRRGRVFLAVFRVRVRAGKSKSNLRHRGVLFHGFGRLLVGDLDAESPQKEIESSTRMSPEMSCPHCANSLIFSGDAPKHCPQCGALLQEVSAAQRRWKTVFGWLMSCAILVFGVFGPCALVGYGGWRFSQTPSGALAVKAILVFLIFAYAIGFLRYFWRKP